MYQTRKIGDVFNFNGCRLQVIETDDVDCSGSECFMFNFDCMDSDIKKKRGMCRCRNDGKHSIFKIYKKTHAVIELK